MIVLKEHAQGWILRVRAHPGARKVGVMGEHAGALKLAVSVPPEEGKANQALGLRRAQVVLMTGATSRHKCFLIAGLPRAELERRVAALLAD